MHARPLTLTLIFLAPSLSSFTGPPRRSRPQHRRRPRSHSPESGGWPAATGRRTRWTRRGRRHRRRGGDRCLRCVNPQSAGFGTAATSVPAPPTGCAASALAAEVQTAGVKAARRSGCGSMRQADAASRERPGPAAARRTAWTSRAVSLPVPAEATSMVFGVLIEPGGGSVTARNMRLEAGPGARGRRTHRAGSGQGARRGHRDRKGERLARRHGRLGESGTGGARHAASASKPSDVYLAIKLLLSRLGDNHSFFMPPTATTAFKSRGAKNPPAEVRSLPEGVGYIGVPLTAAPTARR